MPSLTQEQITQARETDLLDYLLSHESGVLKREGANYRHREHDSLVYVASKNYWYRKGWGSAQELARTCVAPSSEEG